MTDAAAVGVLVASGLGLAGIALYRGIKIRRLKRQLREAQA